jgi:hypothetical protein
MLNLRPLLQQDDPSLAHDPQNREAATIRASTGICGSEPGIRVRDIFLFT